MFILVTDDSNNQLGHYASSPGKAVHTTRDVKIEFFT